MLSSLGTYRHGHHGDIDNSLAMTMTRSARRGPWLPEEDQALLQLVRTQSANNWVRISQQIQHRSPKQCRERYHQNLKPSLKHDPISTQEGEMIERLVQEMGKRWAEIARRLGNRSDNAVKNWWNGSVNRRRRNPAQTTSGFKQVGSRLQPVPFTRLPEHDYTQRSHATYQPSHNDILTSYPTSTTASSTTGPVCLQIPSPVHTRTPSTTGLSPQAPLDPSTINVTQSTISSGHVLSDPRVGTSTMRTSEPRPELPPIRSTSFHLPHSHRINSMTERSPISPALSDTSQRHAPSLISDSQSVYSISPRTGTTPRSGIPAPIEINSSNWSDTQTGISNNNPGSYYKPSYHAELYQKCANPVSYDPNHHRLSLQHSQEDRLKDSRMNVSTLLQ